MSTETSVKTVECTRVKCDRCPASASYELGERDAHAELRKRGWSVRFMGLDLCPKCLEKGSDMRVLRSRAQVTWPGLVGLHTSPEGVQMVDGLALTPTAFEEALNHADHFERIATSMGLEVHKGAMSAWRRHLEEPVFPTIDYLNLDRDEGGGP